MAIKVKHEGNVASRIVGSAEGGRGKRAAEDARAFAQIAAQENMAANRQLQGAHASPVAPGHASPGGGGYAHAGGSPGIMSPPAPFRGGTTVSGGRGVGAGSSGAARSSGGADGASDYVVTGTSRFSRPDAASQWDPGNGGRWIRPWLPGEKEALVQRQVGDVKNDQAQSMYDFKLTRDQRAELDKINSAVEDARRSGRFTPAEMAELERQAYERRAGIKPLPVPKEETAQQQFDKRLVSWNGQQGYLNSKGDFVAAEGAQQSASDVYGGTHVDEDGRRWGVDKSGKLYELAPQRDDFAEIMKLVPQTEDIKTTDPVTGKTTMVPQDIPMERRMEMALELAKTKDQFIAQRRQQARAAGTPGTEGQAAPAWDASKSVGENVADMFGMFGYPDIPMDGGAAPVQPQQTFPAWDAAKPVGENVGGTLGTLGQVEIPAGAQVQQPAAAASGEPVTKDAPAKTSEQKDDPLAAFRKYQRKK